MRSTSLLLAAAAASSLVLAGAGPAGASDSAALDAGTAAGQCATSYPGVTGPEPLSGCQWDMDVVRAVEAGETATGAGVRMGVIDSGVDLTHPDLAGGIDVDTSCSFIYSSTPTADPKEVANGDCTDKGRFRTFRATAPTSPPPSRPGARYVWISGTSMASPHVAGAPALVRERYPRLSPGAVAALLRSSAAPKACPLSWPVDDERQCTGDPDQNTFYGSGMLDAGAAVSR